jgi:hypothetical protein
LDGFSHVPHAVLAIHAVDLQVRHGEILSRAGNFVELAENRGA